MYYIAAPLSLALVVITMMIIKVPTDCAGVCAYINTLFVVMLNEVLTDGMLSSRAQRMATGD